MSALPPVPPDINRIAWPLLFAGLVNWCLYGILVVQCYVYSYNFPADRTLLKVVVYGVLLIETVQTGLNGLDLHYWFISGYGNLKHIASPYASAFDVPIIESIVSLVVEFFFAYRIWVLSVKKARWFCLLICLFSVLNAVAAFTIGIYAHVNNKFPSGKTLQSYVTTWMVGNAAADILIASAMIYYLVKRRGDTANFFSSHALVKIVRLTVETNVLTTSVGIVSLLMVVVYPNEDWYACPTSVLGKLYSNTLLVSLNNRISIREGATNEVKASRNPGVVVQVATTTRSDGTSTMVTDLEQPPAVYNVKLG